MKIKKDMIVKVVSGNFKGMTGKVLKVIPISQRAIVEGVALTKRAVRPTQENPQGGFSERERSLHVSNLMVLEGDDASRKDYVKGKGWYEWPISHIPVLLLVSLVGITITFATQFGFLASFIFL